VPPVNVPPGSAVAGATVQRYPEYLGVEIPRMVGVASTPSPSHPGRPHDAEGHPPPHPMTAYVNEQGEMVRLPPHVIPNLPMYSNMFVQDPRAIYAPPPLDMKIDKSGDKGDSEKGESRSASSTPDQFGPRGGAPRVPHGQSSPHVIPSPIHDRSTDSPLVAHVYNRHVYPPYEHPFYQGGRIPTPGTGDRERPHISSPSGQHVFPPVLPGQEPPSSHHQPRVQTPIYANQVPPQADSLQILLQDYPVTWAGLLGLKNDQAAVQMYFVSGSMEVARGALPVLPDRTTSPIRISQRMRLEQTQLEGVARKMQIKNEHCMLLALPHGRDSYDMLQQQTNLRNGFITYLGLKQAAGIVNVPAPGSHLPAFVVHIFPPCDFSNENLARIAPDLLHRVADLSYLVIVIATC